MSTINISKRVNATHPVGQHQHDRAHAGNHKAPGARHRSLNEDACKEDRSGQVECGHPFGGDMGQHNARAPQRQNGTVKVQELQCFVVHDAVVRGFIVAQMVHLSSVNVNDYSGM